MKILSKYKLAILIIICIYFICGTPLKIYAKEYIENDDLSECRHELEYIERTEGICTENGHPSYFQCKKCNKIICDITHIVVDADMDSKQFDPNNTMIANGYGPTIYKGEHLCQYNNISNYVYVLAGDNNPSAYRGGFINFENKNVHPISYTECTYNELLNHNYESIYERHCDKNSVKYNKCIYCNDMIDYSNEYPPAHTLIHHTAKAPNYNDGNKEYYECTECHKYFSDKNGENEITLEDTIIKGKDYENKQITYSTTDDSVSIYSNYAIDTNNIIYNQSNEILDIKCSVATGIMIVNGNRYSYHYTFTILPISTGTTTLEIANTSTNEIIYGANYTITPLNTNIETDVGNTYTIYLYDKPVDTIKYHTDKAIIDTICTKNTKNLYDYTIKVTCDKQYKGNIPIYDNYNNIVYNIDANIMNCQHQFITHYEANNNSDICCTKYDTCSKCGYTKETIITEHNWNDGEIIRYNGKYIKRYTCLNCDNIKEEDNILLDISQCTIDNILPQQYSGYAITPKPFIIYNDYILREGRDYSLSYTNNVKIGTSTIRVTGIGNYTGTMGKTFKIIPRSISKCTISSISDRVYSGSKITPNLTIKYNGGLLKKNIDYTVTYSNNLNVGLAKVTIKGKGNFNGTVTKTFKIVPKGTSFTKVSSSNKQLILKWTPQKTKMKTSYITGYQIQYSTSKTFATGNKTITVSKYSTTSKTIKNLIKGKTYYIRIRTYKIINDTNYYSKWSNSKNIKIK